MPKIVAIFTRDEIMNEIPYQLICETHSRSLWGTSRTQKAYKLALTEDERKRASILFNTAKRWTLKTGVPETVKMTGETYALWKKLGRFCALLIDAVPFGPNGSINLNNDRLDHNMAVQTPGGRLVAKDCSEENYPGIAVMRFDKDGKEAGAAVVECDLLKNTFNIRVYSPDDPDGDPAAYHVFPLDTRKD